MNKLIIMFVLMFTSAMQTKAQTASTKSFEITAAAHGFMCPFLTPKYIQRIESMDSCKVWKTEDLVIHVEFKKLTDVDSDKLLIAAEKIGYERKNITVKEILTQ